MASDASNSSPTSSVTTSTVYRLHVPLVQGSETVTELNFRRPKLKHLKALDGARGDIDRIAKLIEVLCDIRPGLIGEIDPIDLNEISEIITGFFPNAPKI